MTRQRLSGLAFVLAAAAFFAVSVTNERRGVWVALGVVFLVLGIARLGRSRRGT